MRLVVRVHSTLQSFIYFLDKTNFYDFLYINHEKKCIICDENKIVAVHHFDKNKKNNDPSNLIPLCPTHHQYCHSEYYIDIEDKIIEYKNKWVKNRNME